MLFTTWLTARAFSGASPEAQCYSLTLPECVAAFTYSNIRSPFPICGLLIHLGLYPFSFLRLV